MENKLRELINSLDQDSFTVNFYLLKKRNVEDVSQKYRLFFGTFDGEAKRGFADIINIFLRNKMPQIREMVDFFDYDHEFAKTYNLDSEYIDGFNNLINKMNQFGSLNSARNNLPNLDVSSNAIIFEILFNEGKRILFFQKQDIQKKIKQGWKNFVLVEGVFQRIVESKNNLNFFPFFDFIFIEEEEQFIIFDRNKFEQVFDYKKYYEDCARRELDSFERKNIFLSTEVRNTALGYKSIMSKITNLSFYEKFSEEILNPENISNYLSKEELKISFILEDGKIYINSIDELKQLMDVVSGNYVQEVVTGEKYRALSKDRIE